MNKHEWEVDCNRYVGFMDIMGFKDMVARKHHDDIGKLLYQMSSMKHILQKVQFEKVKSITFSDSLLFVTKGDTLSDLLVLASVLKIFQVAAIQRGAPTKGAVSFGRLTADFQNSIFYGQPLIDAYLLQDQLKYYGIVIDNEVESKIIDGIRNNLINREAIKEHFDKLPTPFKSGEVKHYNIRLSALTNEEMEDMYKTACGEVRKYVDNTIHMYQLMDK